MQTINEYLYKAKVLKIDGENIEVEFNCGFHLYKSEIVVMQPTENRTNLSQNNLIIGQEYYVKSLKSNTEMIGNRQQINLANNNYKIQVLEIKPRNYFYKATVISVHDGDTFKACIDTGFSNCIIMDIRMHGINAPELSTGLPGTNAKIWLTQKILNKEIVLETFKQSQQFEKYGRYLANVYTPELFANGQTTKSINAEMIRAGLAIPMIY